MYGIMRKNPLPAKQSVTESSQQSFMADSFFKEIYLMGNGSVALECARLLSHHSVSFKFLETPQAGSLFFLKRLHAGHIASEGFTSEKLEELVNARWPALILSVNNTFIFPTSLVANRHMTIINYHNSLLPLHRGMHAEAWAIFEGDSQSGVTWHLVDDGIDTGEIICQQAVPLDEQITSIGLLQMQSSAAVKLLQQNLSTILANNFKTYPNHGGDNKSIHYKNQIPGDAVLDTAWSDAKIWRFLRSMDYGPYNNLGNPVINFNGNLFSWHGYSRGSGKNREDIIKKDSDIIIRGKIFLHNVYLV